MKEGWRHAFAVDARGCVEPDDAQRAVADRVCAEIVRRHLTTPALIFLEMFRPMNYIGAQAMHFFAPIVTAVVRGDGYRHFTGFLEARGSVDYLCRRIEEIEAGRASKRRRSKRRRSKGRGSKGRGSKGRGSENRQPSRRREWDESEDERNRS